MASSLNKIEDQKQTAFVQGFNVGGQSVSPVHTRKYISRDFNVAGVTQTWTADEDFALNTIYLQAGLFNNTSSDVVIDFGISGYAVVRKIFYLRTGVSNNSVVAIPIPSWRIKKGEIISYTCTPSAGVILGGATFSLIGHAL